MDWKLKLMQILECVADHEGTYFETSWDSHGVSTEERNEIEAAYEAFREPKRPKVPTIGEVWRKIGSHKFVVRREDLSLIGERPHAFEFVCSIPHEDEDYSYLCWKDWCRCCQ